MFLLDKMIDKRIAAYQSERYGKFGPEGFADASRQAVIDMITDIDQAFASVGR